ncbi:U3 small nucleolar RNA-associated protein 25 homolog isoform X5 [Physeter macrocephalus]|uniref:U3 small nucleolar RNA-associated protein 25 homolog isoform X5 n=1 Tax=Physeter macrocephalus TaxID=9755 RepID=A0A455B6P7_PHYMC|nr:U3 small nucleolar RNA-associated protein 25 homolog isoform X5 [Physeter catodon]|eukprot:XP_028344294.1 digestive organ expansion factor homolog isoform X4 [Physeter catodon]
MGKRGSRSRSQLLNSLTKKQKKHLRDFGEEHPFYDRVSRKEAKPQTCQLSESLDTSSSESEAESEPEQVSGYSRLLATLKDVSKEDEEEEEEEDSVIDETEMNLEDGDSDISVEEETAVESTDIQKNAALPADPKGKDGHGPPGTSEESPEEFTDAKHESLFSLETNFLEEERGGHCSLKASQDPFAQHVNKELKEKEIQAVATNPKTTHQLKWPILGQLVFSSRFQQLETFKPPKDIDLKSLHLQKPLESTWIKTNSQFLSGPSNSSSPFTPLQKELFLIMNSYRDLFYPERTALKNGEEIRHVYCLHVINHVLKANAQVLANNSRCRSQKLGVGDDDDFRDQGLTRPKHLMNHMNLLPLDSHGVDFSRVRMWSLNNWSKYYRQTLLFGALQDAQINSVFNKYCINVQGQVAVRNVPMTGSISHVLVQLPHVFQRIEAENLASVIDASQGTHGSRMVLNTWFNFFVNKILPQYRDAVMSHTLIYVPSYFDFVRLRNYFKKEELNFTHICEYTRKSGVSRARHFFLQGEKQFLLLTERFHFYKRYTIKGIRNLIFYELPTYPHFYSEVCNMLQATTRGEEAAWTCTVLYSKYDAQRLAAVVGVERAAQMLQSKKNVHLFITGER